MMTLGKTVQADICFGRKPVDDRPLVSGSRLPAVGLPTSTCGGFHWSTHWMHRCASKPGKIPGHSAGFFPKCASSTLHGNTRGDEKTPLGQPWLAPCEATAPAAIIRGLSALHTGRGSGVLKLIFTWSFQLTSHAIVAGKTAESGFPREDGNSGHLCGWSCWQSLLPVPLTPRPLMLPSFGLVPVFRVRESKGSLLAPVPANVPCTGPSRHYRS
jgi:hypothetical protein